MKTKELPNTERYVRLIFRKFHHLYLIFELTQIKTSVKMKINKGSFPNEPTCARSGRATAQKSLAGALGIPKCMPPIRRQDFHSKKKG